MKSSIRTFALATSVIAITLSTMPTNAAALTRKAGDRPMEYMITSAAASSSSAGAAIEVVSMLFDYLGHPPW